MAVLNWPKNAAYDSLHEALIIFKDVYGAKPLRNFLLQELTRELCLGEVAERNRRLATAAAGAGETQSTHLQIATDALRFYAERSNYADYAAPIAADQGHTARRALTAIGAINATPNPLEGAN